MISSTEILKEQPLKLDVITILDPDGRYLNDFVTEMEYHASLQVGDIAEFIKTGVLSTPNSIYSIISNDTCPWKKCR